MLTRTCALCGLLGALLCFDGIAVAEPLGSGRAPEEMAQAPRLLSLRQQLTDQLRTSAFRKVRVGVSVINTQDGSELYSQNADAPFNPASNAKILTTAAALSTLGADFRYRTVLLSTQPLDQVLATRRMPAPVVGEHDQLCRGGIAHGSHVQSRPPSRRMICPVQ